IANACIVITDLRGFTRVMETVSMTTVEQMLEGLFGLINRVAREHGGTVRFGSGDAYCLTFDDAGRAMAAAEQLRAGWDDFVRAAKLACGLNVAVHQGLVYAFRSYFYGPGINVATGVEGASKGLLAPGEGAIFVTGEVWRGLA